MTKTLLFILLTSIFYIQLSQQQLRLPPPETNYNPLTDEGSSDDEYANARYSDLEDDFHHVIDDKENQWTDSDNDIVLSPDGENHKHHHHHHHDGANHTHNASLNHTHNGVILQFGNATIVLHGLNDQTALAIEKAYYNYMNFLRNNLNETIYSQQDARQSLLDALVITSVISNSLGADAQNTVSQAIASTANALGITNDTIIQGLEDAYNVTVNYVDDLAQNASDAAQDYSDAFKDVENALNSTYASNLVENIAEVIANITDPRNQGV